MNGTTQPAAHLPEGDLVRHLDGELEGAEREWVLAHLADCQTCSDQLEALRLQSQRIAELIAGLPVPALSDIRRARMRAALKEAEKQAAARRVEPRRWALRAAAVGTVAFTAALAADPVRSWIAERWDDPAPRTAMTASTPAAQAGPEQGSRIAFQPTGEVFRLEFAHPQRQGTLTVQIGEVEAATAQVVGGTGDILVLPNGIRIANERTSTADYLVTLPASIAAVHLQVGGARELTIRPGAQTQVFELTGNPLRQ